MMPKNKLLKYRNCGVKTVAEFKSSISRFLKDSILSTNDTESNKDYLKKLDPLRNFPLFSNLSDRPEIIPTEFVSRINDPLTNLGLNQRAINVVQMAGIRYIKDLLMLPKCKLLKYRNCGVNTVTEFKNKITKYLMEQDKDHSSQWDSFDSMIKDLIKIKNRNLHIFKNRLGIDHPEPQTLEDSGYDYGLTRERTRQIITNIYRKLNSKVNKKLLEPFWLGMDLILDKYNGYVFGSDIVDDLCDLMNWDNKIEGHAIIEFSKLHKEYLINEELKIISLKSKTCSRCKYKMEFFNSFNADIEEFNFEDLKPRLKSFCEKECPHYDSSSITNTGQIVFILSEIDYSESFIFYKNKFLTLDKYRKLKETEKRNRMRENNSPIILLEDYLAESEGPLTNDEILIYYNNNGIEYKYNIASLVQRSELLYSWGRGSVIHKKNIYITSDLLQIISDFIEKNIDNQFSSIVVYKIFDQFSQECIYQNIPDQIALYSALSLNLADCFYFPGYPIISKNNEFDISLSSLVEMYIANFNSGINYTEARDFLTKEMGLNIKSFRFQVNNNDSIIKLNGDKLIHKKYLISRIEEEKINTFAEFLLAYKNLSPYALQNHFDSFNSNLPQNISLDSIIAGNRNIKQNNGVYTLTDSSELYGLSNLELIKKLDNIDHKLNFDRQVKEYLNSYFSNELKQKKIGNNNPLDDILDEFGE